MNYLPIFVSTGGCRAIVVGGGLLAEAKCRALLKTAAEVVLFCQEPTPVMLQWRDECRLQLETRACDVSDLQTARLVYAASECDHEDTPSVTTCRAGDHSRYRGLSDTPLARNNDNICRGQRLQRTLAFRRHLCAD